MKQMTFIVSGNVQKSGYRDRVIELGNFVNLTGYAENLSDGTVRIVAEGEEDQLDFFRKHIDIKNTLIHVDKIEYTESEATNKFNGFLKLVSNDETDARLDTAAKLMKELIDSVRSGFKDTVGAINSVKEDTTLMLKKQDLHIEITKNGFNEMLNKQDESLKMQNLMLDKQDESLKIQNLMLNKQDESLKMQNLMLDKQDESLKSLNNINNDTSEMKSTLTRIEFDVRDTRFSLSSFIEEKFKKQEVEIAEIKGTLARLQQAQEAG